jgi:hypothetical protein
VDGLMFARCSHAPGLLGWLESTLKPLPFAMCFSAAEERPGGILALPNRFLKTLVAQRYADELERYAASVGLSRVEIVVDPTVSAPTNDAPPAESTETTPATPVREQPPGLTTRFFAERGFWQIPALGPGRTRELDDLRGQLRVEAGAQGACGTYEAMVFSGLLAVWGDGHRAEPGLRRLSGVLGLAWGGRTAAQLRTAIERLKTTTYRTIVSDADGGRERLFSLLDEIETTWVGPPTTIHRRIRAVFSRTTWEVISEPRILRTVDLAVLRKLGPRRELARRLFYLLRGAARPRAQSRRRARRATRRHAAAREPRHPTTGLEGRPGASCCRCGDHGRRASVSPCRARPEAQALGRAGRAALAPARRARA